MIVNLTKTEIELITTAMEWYSFQSPRAKKIKQDLDAKLGVKIDIQTEDPRQFKFNFEPVATQ